jgi:hypothetical protein
VVIKNFVDGRGPNGNGHSDARMVVGVLQGVEGWTRLVDARIVDGRVLVDPRNGRNG